MATYYAPNRYRSDPPHQPTQNARPMGCGMNPLESPEQAAIQKRNRVIRAARMEAINRLADDLERLEISMGNEHPDRSALRREASHYAAPDAPREWYEEYTDHFVQCLFELEQAELRVASVGP